MKLLDRYVLTRFLGQFLWAVVAATIIFLAVDLVEQLDKFIDNRVSARTVLYFYVLYIPYIVYLILPVATLLGTLFTIGGMTMSNELTAMSVSGVSFRRPLMVLILVTGITAALGFILGESLVTQANRKRMDIQRYEVKRMPRESRARQGKFYMQVRPGEHIYINRYDPATREAFGISVVQVDGGRIVERCDAPKMVWRDNRWWLQEAVVQSFQPQGTIGWQRPEVRSLSGGGLRPEEFERVQAAPEEMNWWELGEFIHRLEASGGLTRKWRVDRLFKVSLPVATVVIVLFGAPLAAIKRRGGTALGFGLSLFVCFVYYGFLQVGKVMGYNGTLPPLASAWVGNLFFGLLGLGIWAKTAR